jgi:cell wall-associated NlpC family hydrolase
VASAKPSAKRAPAKKHARQAQTSKRASSSARASASARKPRTAKATAGKSKRKAGIGGHGARRDAKVARRQPQASLPNIGRHEILDIAARHLGTPYRRGGTSDRGVDCSGFVRRVFSEVGLDLPHSARAQFSMGERIDADDLQPGDLVFFRTRRRGASHVGIYAGDRHFIHAAYLGREVRVDLLDDHYYRTRYLGARRMRWES